MVLLALLGHEGCLCLRSKQAGKADKVAKFGAFTFCVTMMIHNLAHKNALLMEHLEA